MLALTSAFLSFLSLCICIICKRKPNIIIIFGASTSAFSSLSMYLLWVALEQSGRDEGYNGPWISPIIPIIYVVFILLGVLFLSIGIYKRKKPKADILGTKREK